MICAIVVALSTMFVLSGCVGLQAGGGTKTQVQKPTLGQQLIDLQAARDRGAISPDEYQAQKDKLLRQP